MHFGQTRKNVPLNSVVEMLRETSIYSVERCKVTVMSASLSINPRWPYKLLLTEPFSTNTIVLCMSQGLRYRVLCTVLQFI